MLQLLLHACYLLAREQDPSARRAAFVCRPTPEMVGQPASCCHTA